jgi:hypothetical protein
MAFQPGGSNLQLWEANPESKAWKQVAGYGLVVADDPLINRHVIRVWAELFTDSRIVGPMSLPALQRFKVTGRAAQPITNAYTMDETPLYPPFRSDSYSAAANGTFRYLLDTAGTQNNWNNYAVRTWNSPYDQGALYILEDDLPHLYRPQEPRGGWAQPVGTTSFGEALRTGVLSAAESGSESESDPEETKSKDTKPKGEKKSKPAPKKEKKVKKEKKAKDDDTEMA